jgi:hypothetical protein
VYGKSAMAAKRTYNTLNGRIRGETDVSGTKYYVADALGSVTGVSQAGTISGAARYSPYGRTISGSSSRLSWLGGVARYPTGLEQASHYYARLGHYGNRIGRYLSSRAPYASGNLYTDRGSNLPGFIGRRKGLLPMLKEDSDRFSPVPCGNTEWIIAWKLPPGSDYDNGILIQVIRMDASFTDCNTGDPFQPVCHGKPFPLSWLYVEIWGVHDRQIKNDPKSSTSRGGVDHFGYKGLPNCLCGTERWIGNYGFYPMEYDEVIKYIDGNGFKPADGICEPAGTLYWLDLHLTGSFTPPGGLPAGTNDHSLAMDFNCCGSRYWWDAKLSFNEKTESQHSPPYVTNPGCPCKGCKP